MQPTERELNQKVEVYIGKTSFGGWLRILRMIDYFMNG